MITGKHKRQMAELRAELERTQRELEAQKLFVSNVAHELRTPLATVIGALDLATLRERTADYYRQTIDDTKDQAWAMAKVIDGLLNLAKADYQKERVKMEPIRLDELLLDVRQQLLRSHPEYHIELLFGSDQADDDRMVTVEANLYLLRIACANLIENNCKYSPNKTAFVQISYFGDHVTIISTDNGRGMSTEERARLFQPVWRGSGAQEARGTGIGMTLVSKIIDLHQGEITVRSQEGEGTTFLVRLRHV